MNSEFNGLVPADFAATATQAVAACAGLGVAEQAKLLAESGLLSIHLPEADGGMGLPAAFLVPVAEAAGRALLAFPLIETLLVSSAARSVDTFVAGETVATIAWQGTVKADTRSDGLSLSGIVGRAPLADQANVLLVRLTDGRAAIVDRQAAGVSLSPGTTIDLVHPESIVRLDNVSVVADAILDADSIARLDTLAAILRAAIILGAADFCLETAKEHTTTRKQFGKALSANQSVRFLLARSKMAVENIRVLLRRATSDTASPLSARSALAVAITGGIQAAESSIQLNGGMGFTWDIPLHFYLRHIRSIEAQADANANLDALASTFIKNLPALAA